MKLDYNESVLANGLRVISSTMPHVESVAVGIWVGVGGRYESRAVSGLSHFIEHLLFKGTRNRSAREISQAIEGKGGYFNAFTQEESTCYYARIAADHAADVVDILGDMFKNPLFDPSDIDKERGVVIEEIMMYRDQPHHLVQDCLGELLWTRHPLGRPLIGTPANIQKISRSRILAFKKMNYVPANTVIAFAGKVDHAQCVRWTRRIFGNLKGPSAPTSAGVTRKTPQENLKVVSKKVEQSHLALGIRLFGRHDPRRFPLKLLSVVLGENMSSRLFQVVRERHGLAYSIHSSVHLYKDTGALVVSAGLDRTRTVKALSLIVKELERLRDKKVTGQEIRRAKDYAIGQLRIGMESTITQMLWEGENIMGYGRFVQPEEVIRKLERVSSEDVQRLAAQILKAKTASTALVVPEERADDLREPVLDQVARL